MTKEDLAALSELMDKKLDEKLTPISERLDKMDNRLERLENDVAELKEDVGYIKEDLQEVRGTTNSLSEWAEAATEYYMHDIHYPLREGEKIS